jgi:hypothetical protein
MKYMNTNTTKNINIFECAFKNAFKYTAYVNISLLELSNSFITTTIFFDPEELMICDLYDHVSLGIIWSLNCISPV